MPDTAFQPHPLNENNQNNQNTLNIPLSHDLSSDSSVPHSLEIEAALLSALLLDNKKSLAIAEILNEECFYAPYNARIYELMMQIIDRGEVVTISTLKHIFKTDPQLQEEGLKYLAELATNANPLVGSSAYYYAETIRDLHRKRELITLGEDIIRSAYDLSELDNTADKQIENAEQRLYNLAAKDSSEKFSMSLNSAAQSALAMATRAKERDGNIGITSGFSEIDDMLGGLHASDMVVLAGRPSMGKTALATNIAFNAARAYEDKNDAKGHNISRGAKVLFFSLEMSADQLALRILGEQTKIPSDRMRRGDIKQKQLEVIAQTAAAMGEVALFIDDTPALSVTALRQRARRMARSNNIGLIIIDYLQLLQPSLGKRYDSRLAEISEITRSLKTIAKELQVPVLALSQLSREVEKREDKIPQLSDLRESGTIEQDADVVMFLYRQEYYLKQTQPHRRSNESDVAFEKREERYQERLNEVSNKAQVVIAKQRHGPTGTLDLHFDAELTRFSNYTDRDES